MQLGTMLAVEFKPITVYFFPLFTTLELLSAWVLLHSVFILNQAGPQYRRDTSWELQDESDMLRKIIA